jgi:hypothetical protein
MSIYHFCTDCEHIKTKTFSGRNGLAVKEVSCPAQFNPMQAKWIPKDGVNPHECPRNENYLQIQNRNRERRHR